MILSNIQEDTIEINGFLESVYTGKKARKLINL